MKQKLAGGGVVLVAALAVACSSSATEKGKPTEPFYRRYLAAGEPLDDKITEQERRVEADPRSAALRNDFGNLLAARRFQEQAIEQYETALELDSSHFLAAYNLGLLYETMGKNARAVSAHRIAIRRKPGFPPAHFRLGRLYEIRGLTRLAIGEYSRAFRIDPAMRDPRHNPLVADSRLIDRVSLENYPRDLAGASLRADAAFAEPWRFRPAPVDRPIAADEIEDPSSPETIETRVPAAGGYRSPPGKPVSRTPIVPRVVEPAPVPDPEPEPEFESEHEPLPEPPPER